MTIPGSSREVGEHFSLRSYLMWPQGGDVGTNAFHRPSRAEGQPVSAATVTVFRQALERFAYQCETVAMGQDVLARVGGPFPVEPVRTLDAIHLATVQLLGMAPEAVVIVTRDVRVRANALAMGWRVE